ncbi:hypothetical protein [Carboxylicivirga sp. N1Y90]|uniref:hypothetical protein n=1 Tax=Carboxylicivirga fragile TaxID=3417571 RepID=UPI003D346E6C|nr:hypothetical protein [Marinilabiliaceae bacterium N1Y90]
MKYLFTKSSIITLCIFACFLCFSCSENDKQENNEPILLVGDKQLTNGMLYRAIPNHLSDEDSVFFAQDYINRWIRSELLLRKAELNLTPEEKDVETLLDEYRRSLLVHQYQQKLLEQKFSPFITGSEISQCYDEMVDNFKLTDPIIKGVFVIVPKTAPNIETLKKLYRSDKQEDMVKLEAYCFQNSKKYEVFFDHWLPMKEINNKLPEPIARTEQFIRYNKHYETSDSLFHYFLAIKEFKLSAELAPMDYVEEKIKAILLNKKRMAFIKQIESDLYEEALKDKSLKFY